MSENISKIFSKYMIVGVANTLTSIAIIVVMYHFGFGDELSNFCGIFGGIIQSILINTRFTFRQKYVELYKSFYFFLILLLAYLCNLTVLFVATNYIGLSSLFSQIAGISNKEKNVFGLMPHPERAIETLLGCDDGVKMLKGFFNK